MPTYTFEYGKYDFNPRKYSTMLKYDELKELLSFKKDQWFIHKIISGETDIYFDNHCRMYVVKEMSCTTNARLMGEDPKTIRFIDCDGTHIKTPLEFPPSRWRLSDELIDVVKMIGEKSEIATYMTLVMSKLL